MEMEKARFIVNTIILLLLLALCSQSCIFAQENSNIEDKVIGSTFKILAKAFVAITDIDGLKKNNINRLSKMGEEKFKTRYAKVYEVIKDLPAGLKVSYGLTGHMTRGEAIKNIESLDKEKIYETIDSIPDAIIAKQFKQYLSKKKQELQKSNLVKQINRFWDKMMSGVNASMPR